MKDYEPHPAGKAIADLSARYTALGDGLTARRIEQLWMERLGDPARRYTRSVRFRRGILSVEVSDDAWKNELLLMRDILTRDLNERLGQPAILDLRLL